jgi:hypothetical protein
MVAPYECKLTVEEWWQANQEVIDHKIRCARFALFPKPSSPLEYKL